MSSERLGVRSADKQVAHCEGGSVRVVLSQPCAWRWEAISPDLFRFMLREPQHDGIFPSSIFHTRHCPRFFTANRHCYCHCNCQLPLPLLLPLPLPLPLPLLPLPPYASPFAMRSFQLSRPLPLSTGTIVTQPGTGQTSAHRLHPMHSTSSTEGTNRALPLGS